VIVGVGVDVVPVERFARALDRTPGLRERVFTPAERELSVPSLAVRFAAKEAVAKALGVPEGLQWQDCEIVGGNGQRPRLEVRGTVQAWAADLDVANWHVSLSHDGGMAVAMVVAEAR